MKTEEDDEFKRIEMESGWRKRQIEQMERSELCSNYGGFCKKEWVGLTDEEIEIAYMNTNNFKGFERMARALENILKGKNT
jgi:hypothetical protein